MTTRIERSHRFLLIMMVVAIIGISTTSLVSNAAAEPRLSRGSVNPHTGEPEEKFLFIVTYTDPENEPPDYVKVIVGNKEYFLSPVNPEDNTYSDGRDYMIKTRLHEGLHTYYFEAASGNQTVFSPASSLRCRSVDFLANADIMCCFGFATIIILIPLICLSYHVHKMRKQAKKRGEKKRFMYKKKNKTMKKTK